jgi:hypothetical protein
LAIRTLPDFRQFLSRKSPVSATFFAADYRRLSPFTEGIETGKRLWQNDLAAITDEYR